ncbi:RIP metalloprotease RseP [Halocola ammonii]
MEILIKAAQLILSLSILVVLHEFGHFLPAKWFKTKVEKFYLFFNPGFSLLKFKKGETEYGVGWLPLGGYVKIAGMIDESMDKEQMKKPAQPWEFRSKPAWQRLIIMVGGVTVNLVLGFLLFAMIMGVWGRTFLPVENTTYGVHPDTVMEQYGFQDGDLPIEANGKPIESVNQLNKDLLLEDISTVTITREGARKTLEIPADFGQLLIDSGVKVPFSTRIPAVIDTVIHGTPAFAAGMQKGDSLIAVNDVNSPFFQDLASEIRNSKDQEISISFYRDGTLNEKSIEVTEEGTIGFGPKNPFEYKTIEYGFLEAIPAGFELAGNVLSDYVVSLKFLFSEAGVKQVGGFIAIGNLFEAEWNWHSFWHTTALLSLILAFMNILPIPALDGGHVLFLLYEIITGRAPSEKFLERAQLIGIIILLGLLLLANGNDIIRVFF